MRGKGLYSGFQLFIWFGIMELVMESVSANGLFFTPTQVGLTTSGSNALTSLTPSLPNTPIGEEPHCALLGSFALMVQALMAVIAISSLVIKHLREKPQRPHLVWALDTSKQGCAAIMVHFSNILISNVSSGSRETISNPCIWYFLNILIDTTIGVLFLSFYLKVFTEIMEALGMTDIESGFYGIPPRFKPWLKQTILFLTAWTCVKFTVVLMLEYIPFLGRFAEWLLSPLVREGNDTKAQVVVVMLLFPMTMNVIQALLIDSVIKNKDHLGPSRYFNDEETYNNNNNHNNPIFGYDELNESGHNNTYDEQSEGGFNLQRSTNNSARSNNATDNFDFESDEDPFTDAHGTKMHSRNTTGRTNSNFSYLNEDDLLEQLESQLNSPSHDDEIGDTSIERKSPDV